ncbi:bifunctional YncE family protein/alkaline phosphatase family protein [Actinomadura fibrosa]|uniref:Alkaline phosphatase family protein n=1 Tax=Actinomadura fibrosa TaxID=111802 RepID=A0ABW2XWW1_9ACTN|nr:bifunctional YncE family protein/alkaline phosphatase family protein [Actinomadura fibrosa]
MQVTRRRRSAAENRSGVFRHLANRRVRIVAAGTAALALAGAGTAYASTNAFGTHKVGDTTALGTLLASDQFGKPVGDRLLVNNGKLLSSTVSPDGRHLAALTTDRSIALTIVDLANYKIIQQAGTAADAALKIGNNNVGQEGPTYSPDGRTLWMPQINGFSRFPVNDDGTLSAPTFVSLPVDGTKHPLPAQAVFSPDGTVLYTAVNGQNRVVALDPATGTIKQSWTVGTAPRDLALVGGKLYVGNEGGRPAKDGEPTLNSYGTQVPADPRTGAATTGTVSVIDVADAAAPVRSIGVGLHPTALHARNGALFVANTGSDTVSIIDTAKDTVVQTITTQPWPGAKVGYEPDGITLTDDGRLLVTLGRANALAVYRYRTPKDPVGYVGLLPTDYFPENVTTVGGKVIVTNLRGIGERGPERTIDKGPGTTPATGHNTHDSTGTLLRFALPDDRVIRARTVQVFQQNGWDLTSLIGLRTGGHARPVPVPLRLGDPSTIKHVFLIVKENRTYDQVLGDDPRGNGDPAKAQFGEDATPNQHALARQFGLYDNTYDVGTNSAEGHNWLMQSDNPEYTESTAGEYERSYDTEDDALGHQRSGTLWSGVQAAGGTVKNYGEFLQFETKPAGATWQQFYCDARNMAATGQDTGIRTDSSSPIPSLNSVTAHDYPKYDLDIPDIYRYEIWKRHFDAEGPAALNMFWLSSDHTGGPPNPIAQVADNDLAVGRIVDHISHSGYWKNSAIFVIEDDTQNGVDHVDGARGPVQVISPWARHGTVDSRYYTQITVVRTIEQILGVRPMNQKDSAATPMYTAFTGRPDYTPFTTVPNRVPLTYGLKTPPPCGDDTVPTTKASLAPAQSPTPPVPAAMKNIASLWTSWNAQQHRNNQNPKPDTANPDQMDHYTWYETHGYRTPYPGEKTILTPAEVPGRYLPAPDSDG